MCWLFSELTAFLIQCLMSIADLILKNVVSFKFTKQDGISGSQTFSYYVFEIIAYYDQHEFGRNQ
jgi:hypothetical protein